MVYATDGGGKEESKGRRRVPVRGLLGPGGWATKNMRVRT